MQGHAEGGVGHAAGGKGDIVDDYSIDHDSGHNDSKDDFFKQSLRHF